MHRIQDSLQRSRLTEVCLKDLACLGKTILVQHQRQGKQRGVMTLVCRRSPFGRSTFPGASRRADAGQIIKDKVFPEIKETAFTVREPRLDLFPAARQFVTSTIDGPQTQ